MSVELPIEERLIALVEAEIGPEAGVDMRRLMQAGDPVGVIMDAIAILNDAEIPLPDGAVDALLKVIDESP